MQAFSIVREWLLGVWSAVVAEYHVMRVSYVLGLSEKRFYFAEFYVDKRKQLQQVTTLYQAIKVYRDYERRFSNKRIDDFLLVRMLCSRKSIKLNFGSNQVEIVTFWHF